MTRGLSPNYVAPWELLKGLAQHMLACLVLTGAVSSVQATPLWISPCTGEGAEAQIEGTGAEWIASSPLTTRRGARHGLHSLHPQTEGRQAPPRLGHQRFAKHRPGPLPHLSFSPMQC